MIVKLIISYKAFYKKSKKKAKLPRKKHEKPGITEKNRFIAFVVALRRLKRSLSAILTVVTFYRIMHINVTALQGEII